MRFHWISLCAESLELDDQFLIEYLSQQDLFQGHLL